jgi:P-type Mg2+ transporter
MAMDHQAQGRSWPQTLSARAPRSGFIRRFMFFFGILSSVFDYLTFGALIYILRATPELFRIGRFQESVISAVMIVLSSRPGARCSRAAPGSTC